MEKESTTKLKILFINASQGVVNRGAETFVKEVSERLGKHFTVKILTAGKLPNRWPLLWRFYIDPQGLFILWFTVKNIPYLWKEKFDVIIPLNGGWQALLVRMVTLLYKGHLIIAGQSGKGWDDRINLLTMPDVFVSLSSSLKSWAKKLNPAVRVEYIPNGVDILKFRPVGSKVNFDLPRPIILCAGALTEEKRIELVIKAASLLPDVSLLVVGEGVLKDKLSKMGKKLLGDRFLLTKSSFEQMPQVYRAADVFTLPSPSYRSFEIVVVEAMATNLPVVVNKDPIREEIIGDAGILIEPTNVEDYARFLKQALLTKWGNRPRLQAEKFSWDKIAIQYKILIEKICYRKSQ